MTDIVMLEDHDDDSIYQECVGNYYK